MKKRLLCLILLLFGAVFIGENVFADADTDNVNMYSLLFGLISYEGEYVDADDTAYIRIIPLVANAVTGEPLAPKTVTGEGICNDELVPLEPFVETKEDGMVVFSSSLRCEKRPKAIRVELTDEHGRNELHYFFGSEYSFENLPTPVPTKTPENPFAEFAGDWKGLVPEMNIDLEFTINEDGTGSYRLTQNDYTETYDATLEAGDKTFKVDLPEKNALNLTGCEGTYRYADGILTLDVTTTFASGRKFAYTIDCERVEMTDESESGAESDGCPNVMGVRNIDQKKNVFDFIDLDTNEKIGYEKLFADGKEIQAFSALNEKKPMVLLFFDKSELEFNSDGSLKQFSISNVSLQSGNDEICYSLEDGVLTILGKRE